MAEYIERDALSARLFAQALRCHEKGQIEAAKDYNWAVTVLSAAPAADVAPVVHGKWIGDLYGYNSCSICGRELDEPEDVYPYCPYCGAKNDGTQED